MPEQPSFEKSYSRLEEILEKMTSSTVSLEESLSLYEEADKLIALCSDRLDTAEKKIQTMIKTREGAVQFDDAGEPDLKDFDEESNQVLSSEE